VSSVKYIIYQGQRRQYICKCICVYGVCTKQILPTVLPT